MKYMFLLMFLFVGCNTYVQREVVVRPAPCVIQTHPVYYYNVHPVYRHTRFNGYHHDFRRDYNRGDFHGRKPR